MKKSNINRLFQPNSKTLSRCSFPDINARRNCPMPVCETRLVDEKPYAFCAEHDRWIIASFEDGNDEWNPIDG